MPISMMIWISLHELGHRLGLYHEDDPRTPPIVAQFMSQRNVMRKIASYGYEMLWHQLMIILSNISEEHVTVIQSGAASAIDKTKVDIKLKEERK